MDVLARPDGPEAEVDALRETCATLRRRVERRSQLHLTAAHELTTPLTALHDLLGILEEELTGPLSAPQRDVIRTARNSVSQLRAQIDDLFDALAFELGDQPLRRQELGVDVLIQDALEEVRKLPHLRRIDLRSILHPNLPKVFVDRTQMRLAMAGLIRNAAHGLGSPGRVTILACPHGAFEPHETAPQVLIAVNDSGGDGTSPQSAQLRPLRDEDEELLCAGQGLAVDLCREVIERHGGRILAASRPGDGTTCCFSVPAMPAAVRSAPPSA